MEAVFQFQTAVSLPETLNDKYFVGFVHIRQAYGQANNRFVRIMRLFAMKKIGNNY